MSYGLRVWDSTGRLCFGEADLCGRVTAKYTLSLPWFNWNYTNGHTVRVPGLSIGRGAYVAQPNVAASINVAKKDEWYASLGQSTSGIHPDDVLVLNFDGASRAITVYLNVLEI